MASTTLQTGVRSTTETTSTPGQLKATMNARPPAKMIPMAAPISECTRMLILTGIKHRKLVTNVDSIIPRLTLVVVAVLIVVALVALPMPSQHPLIRITHIQTCNSESLNFLADF